MRKEREAALKKRAAAVQDAEEEDGQEGGEEEEALTPSEATDENLVELFDLDNSDRHGAPPSVLRKVKSLTKRRLYKRPSCSVEPSAPVADRSCKEAEALLNEVAAEEVPRAESFGILRACNMWTKIKGLCNQPG